MKTKKRTGILFLTLLIGTVAAALIYINTYYRAGAEAGAIAEEMKVVGGNLYFEGEGEKGIIFYPGGKVDEKAYAVLAQMLNREGYTICIAKMPVRLSILDSIRAESIIEDNPQIAEWYIVGHSLGGTSASIYVDENPEKVSGVIFLGSYAYRDLSGYEGFALTLTGDNDLVLDRDKAGEAMDLYPQNTTHITIEGGNHAGFGDYGPQSGDGDGEISWEEQHEITVQWIKDAIENHT